MSSTDRPEPSKPPVPTWKVFSIPSHWEPYLVALSLTLTAVGTVLAFVALVFGGFGLPGTESIEPYLDRFATAFPVVGAIVVVIASWWVIRTELTKPTPLEEESDDESRDPFMSSDDNMQEHLDAATEAQYHCEPNASLQTIRGNLLAGAVRAVRVAEGYDQERAREAVRDGSWTDDPVAAGFLAREARYPLDEWLYGIIDPGGAYRHRIRRTLGAIEALEADEATETNQEGHSSTDGDVTETVPSNREVKR